MAPQTAVVVTFYSRCGNTETLALAAAVGAVQGRSLIRLRRLPDRDGSAPMTAECEEAFTRMGKEYVPPTEKDILNNAALILVPRAGATTESAEWAEFCALLVRLGANGQLAGKVGAVVDSGNEETARSFGALIERAGMRRASPDEAAAGEFARHATATGRKVAAEAQRLH
jgi:hypothetical protein